MTSLAMGRRTGRITLTRGGAKQRKSNARRMPRAEGGPSAFKVVRGAGLMVGRLALLGLVLTLVASLSLGLLFGYRWLTANPYFALRQVEVVGNSRLGYTDVLEIAGVRPDENTLGLNIRDVEGRLSSHPWIKSVAVERILPGMLRLTLTEKEAAFWVQQDGRVFYAEATGALIAPVEPDRFASLPVVELMPGAESWLDEMPRFAAQLGTGRWFFGLRDIEWLQAGGGNLTLVLADGRSLSLDMNDWEAGLDRMDAVADDMTRRGEWNFARHLQASGGRVWVRLMKNGA